MAGETDEVEGLPGLGSEDIAVGVENGGKKVALADKDALAATAVEEPQLNLKPERETWDNRLQFFLSCVGYSVGLGNVWRFPFLVYSNGGGSFLIPYFIALILLGIPLYLLELTLGQCFKRSTLSTLRTMHWRLGGTGIAMAVEAALVSLYYNVVIAWSLYYLVQSFRSPLPWIDKGAEAYFNDSVLQMSSGGVTDVGGLVGPLVGALAVAWLVIYLAIFKGIGWSGKLVYFTATFPFVLLIALFFISVTREGAGEGIKYYLTPSFKYLLKFNTWRAAANQIFFSLGIGFGSLITFASFNKDSEDVVMSALTIPVINCMTSFFAGFVVFGMLGSLARSQGKSVAEVVESGIGLAFIAYPDSISKLPGGLAGFTSFLFFFMLFLLGVDSQLGQVEVITCILDESTLFRSGWMRRYRRELICLIVCVVGFLGGLLLVTNGGIYWVEALDYYCGIFGLLLIAIVLVSAVLFVEGPHNLSNRLHSLTGKRIPAFVSKGAWPLSLVLMTVLLSYAVVDMIQQGISRTLCSEAADQSCPVGIQFIVWCIALCPVFFLSLFSVVRLPGSS